MDYRCQLVSFATVLRVVTQHASPQAHVQITVPLKIEIAMTIRHKYLTQDYGASVVVELKLNMDSYTRCWYFTPKVIQSGNTLSQASLSCLVFSGLQSFQRLYLTRITPDAFTVKIKMQHSTQ